MTYSSLVKRIFVIIKTKWFFELLKGNVFSPASYEIVSNLKVIEKDFDCIIDVGANKGQFSKVIRHFYPKSQIYAFEPVPEIFQKTKSNFAGVHNYEIYNVALGNADGEVSFNKNEYGHISSFLEVSGENKHYPKTRNSEIKVQIKKLDDLFRAEQFKGKTLLKLDVQGFELEVLKGADNLLKNIDYVIIEANLENLYVDQPTFTEINTFLNLYKFEVYGMLDFNIGKQNKYIEIDILYKNSAVIK